jgi:type III pantothenate kinase
MLLAIDIGNTNTSFGVFAQDRMIKKFDIPTAGFNIKELKARIGNKVISEAIICSVVPKATTDVRGKLKKLMRKNPLVVGQDIKVPIKNLYRKPGQLGQDRLVNAFAATALYGAPLIVIDFGTAVTFDVVSRNKEYLGGMILPGVGMSLEALHCKTALLPKIKLSRPKEFIGFDTQSSILSGVVYGIAAVTDELVRKIRLKIGKDAAVIGTGSSIKLIRRYCRVVNSVDPDLTVKGLNFIFARLDAKPRR